MNKSEITSAIAKEPGLTQESADKFIKSLIKVVTKALQDGKKIMVPGFVTITKSEREARIGRNPQTGKEIKIPAKKVIKIKAGKTLDESVNS